MVIQEINRIDILYKNVQIGKRENMTSKWLLFQKEIMGVN
jgi:hypothetical protein